MQSLFLTHLYFWSSPLIDRKKNFCLNDKRKINRKSFQLLFSLTLHASHVIAPQCKPDDCSPHTWHGSKRASRRIDNGSVTSGRDPWIISVELEKKMSNEDIIELNFGHNASMSDVQQWGYISFFFSFSQLQTIRLDHQSIDRLIETKSDGWFVNQWHKPSIFQQQNNSPADHLRLNGVNGKHIDVEVAGWVHCYYD